MVPGVPVKDVRVYEVHSWGPELGLRPGASRASGLRMLAPPSLPTRPAPALPRLASTGCGLPPPHSRFLPRHRAVQPAAPPPVPWALTACEGQLALGPRGLPPPPPGPWAACKPDANYLHCDLEGALTLPRYGQWLKTFEPLLNAECWATTWRWQVYTGMTMQCMYIIVHPGHIQALSGNSPCGAQASRRAHSWISVCTYVDIPRAYTHMTHACSVMLAVGSI